MALGLIFSIATVVVSHDVLLIGGHQLIQPPSSRSSLSGAVLRLVDIKMVNLSFLLVISTSYSCYQITRNGWAPVGSPKSESDVGSDLVRIGS